MAPIGEDSEDEDIWGMLAGCAEGADEEAALQAVPVAEQSTAAGKSPTLPAVNGAEAKTCCAPSAALDRLEPSVVAPGFKSRASVTHRIPAEILEDAALNAAIAEGLPRNHDFEAELHAGGGSGQEQQELNTIGSHLIAVRPPSNEKGSSYLKPVVDHAKATGSYMVGQMEDFKALADAAPSSPMGQVTQRPSDEDEDPERRPSWEGHCPRPNMQQVPLSGGMFADSERMKASIRANLVKPVYNVHDFYKKTGFWQALARHPIFENTTLAVISVNAIWLWIDTDYNHAESLMTADPLFQVAEQLFCVYFTFEWFTRFMAFQRKINGLKDGWFVFDSCLVFMMVMETWVMTLLLVITGVSVSSGGAAGLLRLLRLLRLSRLARMLRSMPELMILIKGMVAATRSVLLTLALLVMVMYVFAIVFRMITDGTEAGDTYFKSVPDAMYTLLVHAAFLDDLSSVATEVGADHWVFGMLFFAFIVAGALSVMNMLIGVLCEVVSAVAAVEKEQMIVTFVKSKVKLIMHEIDANNDGLISSYEFVQLMQRQDCVLALQEVGVDPEGLIDFADFIFQDPNSDNPKESAPRQLAVEEFLDIVLQLRGSNTVTVKDMVDFRKHVIVLLKRSSKRLFKGPTGQGRRDRFLEAPKADQTSPTPCFQLEDTLTQVLSELKTLTRPSATSPAQRHKELEALRAVVLNLEQLSEQVMKVLEGIRGSLPVSSLSEEDPIGGTVSRGMASQERSLMSPGVELRVCLSRVERFFCTSFLEAMQALGLSLPRKGSGEGEAREAKIEEVFDRFDNHGDGLTTPGEVSHPDEESIRFPFDQVVTQLQDLLSTLGKLCRKMSKVFPEHMD
ncbi:unnamed protein product [Polarella glacialis]|uniref:EF-hand domain-containing protein n=1 Tax=Polarella glacialis TaxID=89957 RepID=A0A813IDB2_POLGL|nr:unnamed protein product [Polarella glacialis]